MGGDSTHGTILTFVMGVLFPSQCFQLLVMFMLGMLYQEERRVMQYIISNPCQNTIQHSYFSLNGSARALQCAQCVDNYTVTVLLKN